MPLTLEEVETELTEIKAHLARLEGPHIEISAGAVDVSGALVEGPQASLVVAEGPQPGQTLPEWIFALRGGPGIVWDPGRAREDEPCIRWNLEGRPPLVWKRGIIGTLDEEQQALYCSGGYTDRDATAAQAALPEIADYCATEVKKITNDQSERIEGFYTCLGHELRERGMEL